MAFSMFLRSSEYTRVLSSQALKLTQLSLHHPVASSLPVQSLALKEPSSTPLLNAVRSFRTSSVRQSAETPHDHSKLWVIEKGVSAVLVPLIPAALILPNKLFDSLLAILVTVHTFWGLEAIAVDYVRASIFGPIIPKIAIGLVYLLSIATLGGLFYIISHDVGIANTIRNFWAIKSEQK